MSDEGSCAISQSIVLTCSHFKWLDNSEEPSQTKDAAFGGQESERARERQLIARTMTLETTLSSAPAGGKCAYRNSSPLGRVPVKGSVHRAQDALAKEPLIVIEAQTGDAANSLKRIRRMRNQELQGERQQ